MKKYRYVSLEKVFNCGRDISDYRIVDNFGVKDCIDLDKASAFAKQENIGTGQGQVKSIVSEKRDNMLIVATNEVDDMNCLTAIVEYEHPDFLPEVIDELTEDMFYDIVNNQCLGIVDSATMLNGDTIIVIESTTTESEWGLIGVDLSEWATKHGYDDMYYQDEVFSCSVCGAYDFCTSGLEYNYKIVDYGILGKNCGCVTEYELENLSEYIGSLNLLDTRTISKLYESPDVDIENVDTGDCLMFERCRCPEDMISEAKAKFGDKLYFGEGMPEGVVFVLDNIYQFGVSYSLHKIKLSVGKEDDMVHELERGNQCSIEIEYDEDEGFCGVIRRDDSSNEFTEYFKTKRLAIFDVAERLSEDLSMFAIVEGAKGEDSKSN